MNVSTTEILMALAGGVLIGAASVIAFATTHKIPGISGVFGRILRPKTGDTAWRVSMIAGLILGAGLLFALVPRTATYAAHHSPALMVLAGLLVGFGSRLGGGCTSGHGVCGMGRGVRDSIAATLIFMATAMLTVWVWRHLLGFTKS